MKYGKILFKEMQLKEKFGNKIVFTKAEWEKFQLELGIGVLILIILTSFVSFVLGMAIRSIF